MLSEFRGYLLADNTVKGIVKTRIYPVVLPQGVIFPAISYNQVSGVRDWTLCGPADWARIRVQVNLWAKSYAAVRTLARAVRQALQGVRVELEDSPPFVVGSIRLDNEFDSGFEDEAAITGVYRVIQDYIVSHGET